MERSKISSAVQDGFLGGSWEMACGNFIKVLVEVFLFLLS